MTRLNRSRIRYTPGLCGTSCTFFCRSGFSLVETAIEDRQSRFENCRASSPLAALKMAGRCACPTKDADLRGSTPRYCGLDHHELAHVFRGEQTDQSFHAVEHRHCRTIAFLHDPKRFFEPRPCRHRRNVAAHDIAHPNGWIILAQSGDQIVTRQDSRHLPGFIEHRKIVLRRGEQCVDCLLQRRALRKRAKFAHHCARNRKPPLWRETPKSVPPRDAMTTKRESAIIAVTAGPAAAMTSSCFGSSGIRSSRATPPIGRSVMSGVLIP